MEWNIQKRKTKGQEHPLDCACQAERPGVSSGRKDSLVV